MAGPLTTVFHALLLISGSLALALAIGLSAVHWAAGRARPHHANSAGEWALGAFGGTALAVWDVTTGNTTNWTAVWILGTVFAAYVTGRRATGFTVVAVDRRRQRGDGRAEGAA
jgi:hypothetical protein